MTSMQRIKVSAFLKRPLNTVPAILRTIPFTALVPPPRFNLVRYHGIFAPASHWRSQVVPFAPLGSDTNDCLEKQQSVKDDRKPTFRHPRNYSWAELLKRVFGWDVLRCPECGGRMRIHCAVNPSAFAYQLRRAGQFSPQ